jgi:hypothetical protein
VTQEPHKHVHYVSLLLAISFKPISANKEEGAEGVDAEPKVGEKRKADSGEEPDCAREILEDMSRAFRGWVEGREWLNMRLGVSQFIDSDRAGPEYSSRSVAILLALARRRPCPYYIPDGAVQVHVGGAERTGRRRRPG